MGETNGCTWYNVLAKHPNDSAREASRRFSKSFDIWLQSTVSRQSICALGIPVEKA